MSEKIFKINGINICTESFGNAANPAVLLIMGAMCSMVYWGDEFCQQLANTGRFVIRYDNRDVRRSTNYEPGTSWSVLIKKRRENSSPQMEISLPSKLIRTARRTKSLTRWLYKSPLRPKKV